MRVQLFPLILVPIVLLAQPEPPPISFTLAEGLAPAAPLLREHRVELHFRYAAQYGYSEHLNGTPLMFALQGAHLFADSATGWHRYEIPATWDTDLRMLVIAGADTMQLALPELGDARYALIERAWSRWDRATPEVIHFRAGHFEFADVIVEAKANAQANEFAKHRRAEVEAKEKAESEAYLKWHMSLPPPPPPTEPYIPPPPPTEEEVAAYWAQQPKLKSADVVAVAEDTVTISFTGRVMLTGGCGSNMPMIGMEQLMRNAWVERIVLDRSQMDCGLPWGDWEDHEITLPLGWWVGAYGRTGEKELLPGTYRLVFVGGDRQEFRTAEFKIP